MQKESENAKQIVSEADFDEALSRLTLDYIAEFAAGAGHELGNPLAIISAIAQKYLKSEQDANKRDAFAKIIEQTNRCYEVVAEIRNFARPPKPDLKRVDLVQLFNDWTFREKERSRDRNVYVETENFQESEIEIETDPALLSCILDALGKNALEASRDDEGKLIFFGATRTLLDDPSKLVVELGVENNGAELSDEEATLVFAPFYSGRQAGRGLGFGLPKAQRYADVLGIELKRENPRLLDAGNRWVLIFSISNVSAS